MDAVKYQKEFGRMCDFFKTNCNDCGICAENNRSQTCWRWAFNNPEQAVSIVEQWSKEHPVKTCLDDFQDKYPKGLISNRTWCNLYNNGNYHNGNCDGSMCLTCPGWSEPAEKYL